MGAYEVVQFTMVLIVFLQLPDVVRTNRLTRSDGFLTILSRGTRPDRCREYRPGTINLAVRASSWLLVAYAIWPEFVEMFETRDYLRRAGRVFTAPWWPIKLAIFLQRQSCVR